MFCSNCRKEVPDTESKICDNCGFDLSAPTDNETSTTDELNNRFDPKTIIPNLMVIVCFFIPILSLKNNHSELANVLYSNLASKVNLSLSRFVNVLYDYGDLTKLPGLRWLLLIYVIPLMSAVVILLSLIKHKKTALVNLYTSIITATIGIGILIFTFMAPLRGCIGVNFLFIIFMGASFYTLYKLLKRD